MNTVRASVRQVVEFSLHESDLSPAAFAARRMREGAAAHKARQSASAKSETAYLAEQSLSAEYEQGAIALRVSGRADGLLLAPDGVRVVEEIKLGKEDNLLIPAHRAQAAMYGHMLCQKEGLNHLLNQVFIRQGIDLDSNIGRFSLFCLFNFCIHFIRNLILETLWCNQ